MIVAIIFFIIYYAICYYAEKAYDAMCIDFLSYMIENENEEDQIKLSKLIVI